MNTDEQRATFENWHDSLFDVSAGTAVKNEYGYPQNSHIQMRWQAWRACVAAQHTDKPDEARPICAKCKGVILNITNILGEVMSHRCLCPTTKTDKLDAGVVAKILELPKAYEARCNDKYTADEVNGKLRSMAESCVRLITPTTPPDKPDVGVVSKERREELIEGVHAELMGHSYNRQAQARESVNYMLSALSITTQPDNTQALRSSAVEVCPDCDIAGCTHIRNRTGAFAPKDDTQALTNARQEEPEEVCPDCNGTGEVFDHASSLMGAHGWLTCWKCYKYTSSDSVKQGEAQQQASQAVSEDEAVEIIAKCFAAAMGHNWQSMKKWIEDRGSVAWLTRYDQFRHGSEEAYRALIAAGVINQCWQPIETAPKDGTVFLAAYSQDYDSDSLKGEAEGWLHLPRYPFLAKWDANYYEDEPLDDAGSFVKVDMCGLKDMDTEPSHWMPLPTPPAGVIKGV